MKAVQPGKS